MDLFVKYFSIAWTVFSSLVMVGLVLLSKTYAKREDLAKVEKKVDDLKAHVDNLPTQQQVTELLVELANTRGEMRELKAKIQPVEHLAHLLLEQRLKDDK
ncbi:TPA: DUF2730 family protein [Vibrio cholerae]|uniref:DUF2730 domain-containing protein n=2 Tax=Vibrio cholerae TaxID=666 RepID=A0A0H3AGS3_VIBC3|nr:MULTISPECIES: DUF2730 family protein [Vibrio]ABQ19487.1 conserved hypothetical protein [Vibrio cholerae O395]ABQ21991.1 conserved hypothetical protein [Vibrio cholerae O395]ACP09177.1 hypothetical protein VC395_1167 [Vibrio cholerae O395]ACP09273.1 hypothetical protein VC395_1264 [Vibrio cholerae O395]AOW83222.1 hypothetical protein VM_11030 [Vibrio mimicus]